MSYLVKQNLVIVESTGLGAPVPVAVFQVVKNRDYIECTLGPPPSCTVFPPARHTVRLAKSGIQNDNRVFIECAGPHFNADFELTEFNVMTSTNDPDPQLKDCPDVSRVILATKKTPDGAGGCGISVTVTSRFNHLIQRLVLERQDFDAAIKEIFP
jgi:hypothetical protein